MVLIPFPFDDLTGHKVRPAVCLTDPIGPYRHLVLAFITSRLTPNPLPTDLVIETSDIDFTATGLRVPSTLQLHRMMTATTNLIKRELGELTPRLQAEVDSRLRQVFGLT